MLVLGLLLAVPLAVAAPRVLLPAATGGAAAPIAALSPTRTTGTVDRPATGPAATDRPATDQATPVAPPATPLPPPAAQEEARRPTSKYVVPGAGGKLVYAADERGNRVP